MAARLIERCGARQSRTRFEVAGEEHWITHRMILPPGVAG